MATKKTPAAKKAPAKKQESVATVLKITQAVKLPDGRAGVVDAINYESGEVLVKVAPKLREWHPLANVQVEA